MQSLRMTPLSKIKEQCDLFGLDYPRGVLRRIEHLAEQIVGEQRFNSYWLKFYGEGWIEVQHPHDKAKISRYGIKELHKCLRDLRRQSDWWRHQRITCEPKDRWLVDDMIVERNELIDYSSKRLAYLKKIKRGEQALGYDIERFRRANIIEVAKFHGFQPRKGGSNYFICLRRERTPSCCLYTDKNTFYDFGSGVHGDVIDFVGIINQCNFKESCNRLSILGF